jgi:AcrR family transcriptional regulator
LLASLSRDILQAVAGSTPNRIIESAAGELREHGLFAVSLEAVRRRAGVSTGSTYHHFPGGMPAVSAEVYRFVLAEYQDAAATVLDSATDAEEGVRAAVIHLLGWIEADPARARLLYQLENAVDPAVLAGTPQVLVRAIDSWLERFGVAKTTDHRAELVALWAGPAKEYGRMWTRNPELAAPTTKGQWFADAAWRSVKPFLRPRRRPT